MLTISSQLCLFWKICRKRLEQLHPIALLESEAIMKKKCRGTIDQCVKMSAKVVAFHWYDTRAVNILSILRIDPSNTVNRYKKQSQFMLQKNA